MVPIVEGMAIGRLRLNESQKGTKGCERRSYLVKSIADKGIASAGALMWAPVFDVSKQLADGGPSWAWERAVDVSKFIFLEHMPQYCR